MMVDRVVISQQLLDEILDHAAQSWPMECCGLLIGRPNRPEPPKKSDKIACEMVISRIVVSGNVAADPAMTFEIDPGLLLRTHRAVRDRGEDIIGCYHSHPNGNILPSRTDLERAEQAGFLWLIAGSAPEGVTDWALYRRIPLQDSDAGPRGFRPCQCMVV
ncbi:Mov34/MPN/PAD-1 family protein [Thalassospira sp. TSL5-1]|uniref:Mov34/MPN/PAD-1 family protein n=1 Tax=Thalassospira sp. TSL5-1 TaxID=1544451 RepID=UPI000AB9E11A|nr:M67 family metallopeptidase [Thalassospira sp. TSL5-1]